MSSNKELVFPATWKVSRLGLEPRTLLIKSPAERAPSCVAALCCWALENSGILVHALVLSCFCPVLPPGGCHGGCQKSAPCGFRRVARLVAVPQPTARSGVRYVSRCRGSFLRFSRHPPSPLAPRCRRRIWLLAQPDRNIVVATPRRPGAESPGPARLRHPPSAESCVQLSRRAAQSRCKGATSIQRQSDVPRACPSMSCKRMGRVISITGIG